MLLLAHLLTLDREWRGARIVLKSVADTEEQKRQRQLSHMTPDVRIAVEVDIVVPDPDREVRDLIQEHSVGADLVMLGFRSPETRTPTLRGLSRCWWTSEVPTQGQACLTYLNTATAP